MTAEELRRGPVARTIREARLVVVLRRVEPQARLIALVDELAEGGARVFEITWDAPSAADDLAAVRDHLAARPDGPFLVGAGTLVRRADLREARLSGADFGVAPLLDAALVHEAVLEGMPFIPGAFTPTEISAAWAAGAMFVKLFPASAVGPSFVRELRGPMPDVELLPTGGLDAGNARDFLDAGAVAVGLGGALTRADRDTRRALIARLTGSG